MVGLPCLALPLPFPALPWPGPSKCIQHISARMPRVCLTQFSPLMIGRPKVRDCGAMGSVIALVCLDATSQSWESGEAGEPRDKSEGREKRSSSVFLQ